MKKIFSILMVLMTLVLTSTALMAATKTTYKYGQYAYAPITEADFTWVDDNADVNILSYLNKDVTQTNGQYSSNFFIDKIVVENTYPVGSIAKSYYVWFQDVTTVGVPVSQYYDVDHTTYTFTQRLIKFRIVIPEKAMTFGGKTYPVPTIKVYGRDLSKLLATASNHTVVKNVPIAMNYKRPTGANVMISKNVILYDTLLYKGVDSVIISKLTAIKSLSNNVSLVIGSEYILPSGKKMTVTVSETVNDTTVLADYTVVNTVNITATTQTSVQNVNINNTKIYPNPCIDELTIDVDNTTTVQIFDMSGKMVIRQTLMNNSNSINVSNLKTGVYIVREGTFTTKIMKQ